MDLKRTWRNGFLVSLIFALPLSDLYFQNGNLIATDSPSKKPVRQETTCPADTGCAYIENGNGDSGLLTESRGVEGDGLPISGDSLANVLLASNDVGSGRIREAALRFSPQDILQSVNLTGGEYPDISDDIQQIADINSGIGSLVPIPFGFGNSKSYAPGHSGPFAPAMFGGGGNAGSAGELQSVPEDATELPITDEFPESSEQTELTTPSDTLHTVPEPSTLVLMTIGIISVASLFHRHSHARLVP